MQIKCKPAIFFQIAFNQYNCILRICTTYLKKIHFEVLEK